MGSVARSARRLGGVVNFDAAVLTAVVVSTGALLVSTVWRSPGGVVIWVDLGLSTVPFLGAAVLCVRRGLLKPRSRAGWWCVAAVMLLNVAGTLADAMFATSGDTSWLAHVCWLSAYPLAYTGLVLLLRTSHSQRSLTLWLDGLIALAAVGAVGYAVAFERLLASSGRDTFALVLNFAYPVGDLILLAMAVWILVLVGCRFSGTWVLLSCGVFTFAVADTVWALRVQAGTYAWGSPTDALWPLAATLIALAAFTGRHTAARKPRQMSRWSINTPPLFFTLVSAGFLVYSQMRRDVAALTIILALICLVLLIPRVAMTYWHVGKLAEFQKQAMTDELTGLPNRRAFTQAVISRLRDRRHSAGVAVMMVDLDHFKEINDSLGHAAGDGLLKLIARRVAESLREDDLLARFGGDTFTVLLHDSDRDTAAERAQRLLASLTTKFELPAISLHVGASVGIAVYPEDATDGSTLLRHADVAVYEAQAARSGYAFYNPLRDTRTPERLRMIEELRTAITSNGLLVYYQPKVELATDTVQGVEALVRWVHPERGLLLPEQFIPLAEHHGLMQPLLTAVLRDALAQQRRWMDAGLDLTMAVNMSTSSLMDADLPAKVDAALERHAVPADRLILELTEDTIMANPVLAREVVSDLSRRGILVSVDDYGTGYSSLAYLKNLAVRELKLDRTFVNGFQGDVHASAIVRSTVTLAHALNLSMVAEGVDTDEAAQRLRELGCDAAQGYLYSQPRPPADLEVWLLARQECGRTPDVSQSQPTRSR